MDVHATCSAQHPNDAFHRQFCVRDECATSSARLEKWREVRVSVLRVDTVRFKRTNLDAVKQIRAGHLLN